MRNLGGDIVDHAKRMLSREHAGNLDIQSRNGQKSCSVFLLQVPNWSVSGVLVTAAL